MQVEKDDLIKKGSKHIDFMYRRYPLICVEKDDKDDLVKKGSKRVVQVEIARCVFELKKMT